MEELNSLELVSWQSGLRSVRTTSSRRPVTAARCAPECGGCCYYLLHRGQDRSMKRVNSFTWPGRGRGGISPHGPPSLGLNRAPHAGRTCSFSGANVVSQLRISLPCRPDLIQKNPTGSLQKCWEHVAIPRKYRLQQQTQFLK